MTTNKQELTQKIEALKVEKNRLIENCGDTTINQREVYRAQIREIETQIDALVTERLNADDEPQTDAHGNALCERCHTFHIFYADSERYCQSCLESEYDAKIAREEAQSLYYSDSGVDADDYRAYIDANAPELLADDNTTFSPKVNDTVISRWLGDKGVVVEINGEWYTVEFGEQKNRVQLRIEDLMSVTDSTDDSREATISETLAHMQASYAKFGTKTLNVWMTADGKWISEDALNQLVAQGLVEKLVSDAVNMWVSPKWQLTDKGIEYKEVKPMSAKFSVFEKVVYNGFNYGIVEKVFVNVRTLEYSYSVRHENGRDVQSYGEAELMSIEEWNAANDAYVSPADDSTPVVQNKANVNEQRAAVKLTDANEAALNELIQQRGFNTDGFRNEGFVVTAYQVNALVKKGLLEYAVFANGETDRKRSRLTDSGRAYAIERGWIAPASAHEDAGEFHKGDTITLGGEVGTIVEVLPDNYAWVEVKGDAATRTWKLDNACLYVSPEDELATARQQIAALKKELGVKLMTIHTLTTVLEWIKARPDRAETLVTEALSKLGGKAEPTLL